MSDGNTSVRKSQARLRLRRPLAPNTSPLSFSPDDGTAFRGLAFGAACSAVIWALFTLLVWVVF